jgi:myo-inositol-1(or 4)-monophosphatase
MSILFVAASHNKPNEPAKVRKITVAQSRCCRVALAIRGFGASNWPRQKIFDSFPHLAGLLSFIIKLKYAKKTVPSRKVMRSKDMILRQQDLSAMLETAIVAARLAGQRAMEEIDFARASVKNATELVTQTDARCQKIIIERIKENYPDHGFIAEEGEGGKLYKQPPRAGQSIWWAIDPIDGTNNFAHRLPCFATSIAAMENGEPIVGVIFEPATESMFTAIKGGEPQLNGRRISAGKEDLNEFASVGLDSHFDKEVPAWACEIIRRTRFRNFGTTALQIVYVAKGSMVATIASDPKLWDIAAGAVIAEAAGAVMTDWQGGKIFPVNLDTYEGGEFRIVAANKKVHPQIMELLR